MTTQKTQKSMTTKYDKISIRCTASIFAHFYVSDCQYIWSCCHLSLIFCPRCTYNKILLKI